MTARTFTAWAIDTRSEEGHTFIGRYWARDEIPVSLAGCQIALFETRKKARAFADVWVKRAFPRAKAVKVKVTIETETQ